ncbi:MAG: hypothetical protein LC776_05415, partial [Acidobacteria bacterium]|nr:hypothetical protein [Acidobacteriota bacterium]
ITQVTGLSPEPPGSDPELAVVNVLAEAVALTTTRVQARASVRVALHALSCADVVPRSRLAVLLDDSAALDAVVSAADDLARISAGRVPA